MLTAHDVLVEQRHREAAADYLTTIIRIHHPDSPSVKDVRHDHPAVQAFARFEQSIRTTDAARVAELERMLGLALDWIDADDFRNMGPAEDRLHTKLIRDIEATLNRSARHAD